MASPSLNTRELKRAVNAFHQWSGSPAYIDHDPHFYKAKQFLRARFKGAAAMFEMAGGKLTVVSKDCRRTFIVPL